MSQKEKCPSKCDLKCTLKVRQKFDEKIVQEEVFKHSIVQAVSFAAYALQGALP